MTEKLKLAEKTAKEIEGFRDGYRPAARRGAVLFFVLSGMAAINSMYQYSLSSYLLVCLYLSHLLLCILTLCCRFSIIPFEGVCLISIFPRGWWISSIHWLWMYTTMPAQVRYFVSVWWLGVTCVILYSGLFEVHKLLFSFAMTTKIQEVESSLNHEELDFFIKVWYPMGGLRCKLKILSHK